MYLSCESSDLSIGGSFKREALRVADASCDHFGLFDRAGVAGPGNRRERRAELAGDGAATLGRGDAVVLAAMHLARSGRLPVAQQVVAAEQLDGLAVALGVEPRHVPAHPGQGLLAGVAAEQARGALAGRV